MLCQGALFRSTTINVGRPADGALSSRRWECFRGGGPSASRFVSLLDGSSCASLAFNVLSAPSPVIASFLLGWVFWSGISYACRSRFFQLLGRICWNFIWRPSRAQTDSADIEAQSSPAVEEKSRQRRSKLSAIHRVSNEAALTFTLNLCFAFAGFADFCSLLAYNVNGDTACGEFKQ